MLEAVRGTESLDGPLPSDLASGVSQGVPMKALDVAEESDSLTKARVLPAFDYQTLESQRPLLSLVIPAYNEKERIRPTLYRYNEVLQGIPHEILVAIDGSSDNTSEVVRVVSKDVSSVQVIEHHDRLGKGGGILAGFREARGEWIAIVDADGSLPSYELLRMVGLASTLEHDGVIANRYWNRNRIIEDYGFLRWFASRTFNLLVRWLYRLPHKDTQCGAKIIRRTAMEAVASKIRLKRYAFDMELLWRLREEGYHIVEVPVTWGHRDGSKIQILPTGGRMLFDLLRLLVSR